MHYWGRSEVEIFVLIISVVIKCLCWVTVVQFICLSTCLLSRWGPRDNNYLDFATLHLY